MGPDDRWENTSDEEMTLRKNQLLSARRAILEGNPQRGRDLASAFIDRYPNSPMRAEAYLIRGDALMAMGDEYEALFEFEEIARNYPNSPAFVTALEREFEIAQQYANGRYRKLLSLFRIVPATDEAQELLIRIQERLPGSRLAEQAGMALADYYFRVRDLRMAAEAYGFAFWEAFEPEPTAAKTCRRQIAANGLAASISEIAIGDGARVVRHHRRCGAVRHPR